MPAKEAMPIPTLPAVYVIPLVSVVQGLLPPLTSSHATPEPVDVNTCPSVPCAVAILRFVKFTVPFTSSFSVGLVVPIPTLFEASWYITDSSIPFPALLNLVIYLAVPDKLTEFPLVPDVPDVPPAPVTPDVPAVPLVPAVQLYHYYLRFR